MPEQPKRPILSTRVRSRADAIGTHADLARSVLLAFAALAAPIGLRAILLIEHSMAPGVGDLRGLLSDVSVALGVAAAVGLIARFRRGAGVGVLLLWVLLCYGNYEHVSANGANMALRHAGYLADETFLRGSALAVTRPWLLVGALVAALGFGWAALRPGARVRLRTLAISCAVAAAAFALWSATLETLGWRQTSFVAQNASWLVRASTVRDSIAPSVPEPAAPDLGGQPLVAFGDAKTNVLLVMFEGVSGAYIEPIVSANDWGPFGISMPELSRIARENVVFTNFIAQQRQTNRGEYALLCGELPRLFSAEAKMTELAVRSDKLHGKRCLPAALAEAGYATAYLQAARTTFMLKDKFMPSIGFERSIGEEYFEDAYSRNKWGVDDRAFLQQSLRMIEDLRGAERPWFLTLLTSGTHHPKNLPEEVLKEAKSDRTRLAFAYLDEAIGEFVAELAARGILDDTLVLLTSDESQGSRGRGLGKGLIRPSQNWGFLVAMLPGGAELRVDNPQAQFDIALSTLDWLGLADYAHGFSGRSVFRHYAKPRALAFGNIYSNYVGGVSADGQLVLCSEDLKLCAHATTDDQRLFKKGIQMSPNTSADDVEFLRKLAAESMLVSDSGLRVEWGAAASTERDFRLSDESNFPIRDDVDDRQWIFGGQYLSVPANSRIDVDLEVEVMGEDGQVEVQHGLKTPEVNYFVERIPNLRPGDRLHFRYSYSTAEPLTELGIYLVVTRRAGSGLSLKLPRARLQIRHGTGSSDPPLVVHQFDVERAPRLDDSKRAARR